MNAHYFPHDHGARNDQKVLQLRFKYGAEGYGLYWMVLETMSEDSTGYINRGAIGGLSLGYGVAIERLQEILDFCVEINLLSICDHGNYYSTRMIKHKSEMTKFVGYGISGAEKRWGTRKAKKQYKKTCLPNTNNDNNLDAMQINKSNKSKVNKENNINKTIIPEHLFDIWSSFEEMRKQIKKPLTELAKKLTIKNLNELSQDKDIQIKILEQSIQNCWQGVFPLKKEVKKDSWS